MKELLNSSYKFTQLASCSDFSCLAVNHYEEKEISAAKNGL